MNPNATNPEASRFLVHLETCKRCFGASLILCSEGTALLYAASARAEFNDSAKEQLPDLERRLEATAPSRSSRNY